MPTRAPASLDARDAQLPKTEAAYTDRVRLRQTVRSSTKIGCTENKKVGGPPPLRLRLGMVTIATGTYFNSWVQRTNAVIDTASLEHTRSRRTVVSSARHPLSRGSGVPTLEDTNVDTDGDALEVKYTVGVCFFVVLCVLSVHRAANLAV